MRITLEIPDGCKLFHFVLCLADDDKKIFGTTDGRFVPENGGTYKVVEERKTRRRGRHELQGL